jgi:hypothetical protein
MIRALCVAVIGAVLTGCAADQSGLNFPPEHPANPNAIEAAIPPRSPTLARNDIPTQPTQPTTRSGHGGHE